MNRAFVLFLLLFITACNEKHSASNSLPSVLSGDTNVYLNKDVSLRIDSVQAPDWLRVWLVNTNTDTFPIDASIHISAIELLLFMPISNNLQVVTYTTSNGNCKFTYLATFSDSVNIDEYQIGSECDGDGDYYYSWNGYETIDFIHYNLYDITNHLKNDSLYDESGHRVIKENLTEEESEMVEDTSTSYLMILPNGRFSVIEADK